MQDDKKMMKKTETLKRIMEATEKLTWSERRALRSLDLSLTPSGRPEGNDPLLLIALMQAVHEGRVTKGYLTNMLTEGAPDEDPASVRAIYGACARTVLKTAEKDGLLRRSLTGYRITLKGMQMEQDLMAEYMAKPGSCTERRGHEDDRTPETQDPILFMDGIVDEWKPKEPDLLIALILSILEGEVTLERMVRLKRAKGPVNLSMKRRLKRVLEDATDHGLLEKDRQGRYTVTPAGRSKEREMMADLIAMVPEECL